MANRRNFRPPPTISQTHRCLRSGILFNLQRIRRFRKYPLYSRRTSTPPNFLLRRVGCLAAGSQILCLGALSVFYRNSYLFPYRPFHLNLQIYRDATLTIVFYRYRNFACLLYFIFTWGRLPSAIVRRVLIIISIICA